MPSRLVGSASSRRSASVDLGDGGFRGIKCTPLSLEQLDISDDDDQERSPLVLSPTEVENPVPAKTQSLNLDKAPGWEQFAKEFKERHTNTQQHKLDQQPKMSRRAYKGSTSPESPGWDRSKHLSSISCGYEDQEVWTDSDDENQHNKSPITPVPEGVILNMARIGAAKKKRSPGGVELALKLDHGASASKYQIETAQSQLPGVPTMQPQELGHVQRAKPLGRTRSRSVDGLAMCTADEAWMRATEPALYDNQDEDSENPGIRHSDDLLSLWAKRVHRLRGSFKLVGEALGFGTGVFTTLVMIRVAVFVEGELRGWNRAYDNQSSMQDRHCSDALRTYRVYYMMSLSLSLMLTLLSSMVVAAMMRKAWISTDKWGAIRSIADELGFLENTDETAYKLCSGLKWFGKLLLILLLFVAAYESQNDSFFRKTTCDPENDVATNLTWWFVLSLVLRLISTGWDVVLTWLPFICVKHCYPELYASQLNTEIAHSTF